MPRKGENIYKRKDRRWEGRIIVRYDEFGKAKYKSFYAGTYTAVKEKMNSYMTNNTVNFCSPENILISYYVNKWLNIVKLRCKISTYNKYRSICKNHIIPVIGKCRIDALTLEQIEHTVGLKAELSAKTQNDILCVIKMILYYAQSEGHMVVNTKGLSIRQSSVQMRVLSRDEQKTVTKYLLTDTDLCKAGVYLSLCTGLRIGELCALKRENISFDNMTLSVRGTMQRVQVDDEHSKTKVIVTEPKSRKSIRDIPLPEFICDFFKKYYDKLSQDTYLLSGRSDRFIEPRLLEYRFRKYMKACSLYDVNFHALRHTFATRCVENGFEIKTLSEILGHINVNITLNRYVHSSMELKRSNMEKLCNVF